MAKNKIDPDLAKLLKIHGANPETDVWDCHGVWVAYHRTLEKIAVKTGIVFDAPTMIEADAEQGVAVICVTGRIGERSEWSFGEAAPKNNKNAYPYAMAEKRAKDRVIIKLAGLHGLYSEEEADAFKPGNRDGAPSQAAVVSQEAEKIDDMCIVEGSPFSTRQAYISLAKIVIDSDDMTAADLKEWWAGEKARRSVNGLVQDDVDMLKKSLMKRINELLMTEAEFNEQTH